MPKIRVPALDLHDIDVVAYRLFSFSVFVFWRRETADDVI